MALKLGSPNYFVEFFFKVNEAVSVNVPCMHPYSQIVALEDPELVLFAL